MSNHVNINIEETDTQGFNGEIHLSNFINYLFRADKAQKHTNDRTDYCLFSVMIDDEIVTLPFRNEEERLEMKAIGAKLSLNSGVGAYGLLNDIAYFDLLNNDGDDIRFNLDFGDVIDMVNEVVALREIKHDCLFHVAHLDQGQWHIHTVLVK